MQIDSHSVEKKGGKEIRAQTKVKNELDYFMP